MCKKVILLLFIFLIIFIKGVKGKQIENSLFIYESPRVDYEEYLNDNHSFVNYDGCIYSVNKSYIVVLSRYYIPIKKIKIRTKDALIESNYEFLYLFDRESSKIYKYNGKKFYFLKKLNLYKVKDFKIYKDNFYFLNGEEILIYDSKFNKLEIKLNNNYLKFKIRKDKIYLINENEILIIDSKGEKINEKTIPNYKIKSFDIDIDDKIYFLSDKGILVFDKNLKFLKEIKLEKEGDEIFFDLSRAVVLYFKNEGIKVLPPQFEFEVIENLEYPSDITIDEDGNIYLLNTKSSEIVIFNKNLKFKNKFGKEILKYPNGIFYYKGKIYVADSWNNKIRVFDKKGNLIFSFGTFGNKENEFSYPSKIKVYNDLIYVLDVYNHKLKIFDLNGNYKYSIGESTYKYLLNLIKPKSILFEPNEFFVKKENIFISDKKNYKLIIIEGKKIKKIKLDDIMTSIFDLKENLYFLGSRWKYVYLFKNNKFLPIFSFSYNYFEKLKSLKPYSLLIFNEKTFLIDRINGSLFIINGYIYE
ncbi:MAG: NHL repeat-containing protein [Caldisericia bacterium]|jgi:outer membrane protein assembly factor BamB|nr:NHL repeat-containing protein [Caldisericia bacterium]